MAGNLFETGLATVGRLPDASLSGCDIQALIVNRPIGLASTPQGSQTKIFKFADVHTISWSSYREKRPVRACGCVAVKGYTRGPRTVAGSMIVTILSTSTLVELLGATDGEADASLGPMVRNWRYISLDQIPPFDIYIQGVNEFGQASWMGIYGIEIQTEGGTFSVEDILSEMTIEYTARHKSPIRPLGREPDVAKEFANQMRAWASVSKTVSDCLASPALAQKVQDEQNRWKGQRVGRTAMAGAYSEALADIYLQELREVRRNPTTPRIP